MRDTQLQARLTAIGVPPARARELTRRIRDELHPIAHVAALHLVASSAAARGLHGTARGALPFAKAGASVGGAIGSVIPVIGTAIGTVIGAVVGAIAGLVSKQGDKAGRRAAAIQLLSQLRALPPTSTGRIFSIGQMGAPGQFMMMFQALYLAGGIYGDEGSKLTDHPTSMDNETLAIIENCRRMMQQMIMLPPGSLATFTRVGARMVEVGAVTFTTIDPASDPMTIAQRVFMPVTAQYHSSVFGPANVEQGYATNPDYTHVMALLADKLQAEMLPQQLSTSLAQVQPVTLVPAPIALAGSQLAQQIANTGTTQPTLVSPTYMQQPPSVMWQPAIPNPSILPTAVMPPPVPWGPPPGYILPAAAMPPPVPWGPAPGYIPTPSNLAPTQDATAGILQTLLSQQGVPMTSLPAQQLAADVASQGVQKTAQGPRAATAGLADIPTPVLLGAGVLLALSFALARPARKRG
jgi:hypothetical protein